MKDIEMREFIGSERIENKGKREVARKLLALVEVIEFEDIGFKGSSFTSLDSKRTPFTAYQTLTNSEC